MTALHWKLVLDANDPHAQAAFWASALGYEAEDNSALVERLLAHGHVKPDQTVQTSRGPAFRDLAAVRHPDDPYDPETGTGHGRRLLFQRVPEPGTGKNRLHLDIHATPDRDRDAEVARLEGLGATVLRQVKGPGGAWAVMADPEGNEYCVH
ncbi:hypothetical protein I3F58_20110 [Streptomyces sp. MUM 203J]|uniref:VOC family protein n=1 Tax=Streptomyces sp. MUM 203J TaxID=2791990 RepID=UPI001F04F79C|nr:VOC family protein [Streptomyces sp. MUM 203J]MCH0541828.1 hypothetical protein [Streptomyces sp. MUM 203J]